MCSFQLGKVCAARKDHGKSTRKYLLDLYYHWGQYKCPLMTQSVATLQDVFLQVLCVSTGQRQEMVTFLGAGLAFFLAVPSSLAGVSFFAFFFAGSLSAAFLATAFSFLALSFSFLAVSFSFLDFAFSFALTA